MVRVLGMKKWHLLLVFEGTHAGMPPNTLVSLFLDMYFLKSGNQNLPPNGNAIVASLISGLLA